MSGRPLPLPTMQQQQHLRPQQPPPQQQHQQPTQMYRSSSLPQNVHDKIVGHIATKQIPVGTQQWQAAYKHYEQLYHEEQQRQHRGNNNAPQQQQQQQQPPPQHYTNNNNTVNAAIPSRLQSPPSHLPLPSNPAALLPSNAPSSQHVPHNTANNAYNSNGRQSMQASPSNMHINQPPPQQQPPPPHRAVTPPVRQVSADEITYVTRVLNASNRHVFQQLHHDKKVEIRQFLTILKTTNTSMSTLQKQIMSGGLTGSDHQAKLKQLLAITRQRQLARQQELLQQQQSTAASTTTTTTTTKPTDTDTDAAKSAAAAAAAEADAVTESQQSDDGNIFLSNTTETNDTEANKEDKKTNMELDLPVEQSSQLLNDFSETNVLVDNTMIKQKEKRTIVKLKPEDQQLTDWINSQYKQFNHIFWFVDIDNIVKIVRYISAQYELTCYNTELYEMISVSLQLYLTKVIEQLINWAKQRYDIYSKEFNSNDILYNPKQLISDFEQQQQQQQLQQIVAPSTDTEMRTESSADNIDDGASQPLSQQASDAFHSTQAALEGIGANVTSFKKQKTTHTNDGGAQFASPLNNMFASTLHKRSLLSRLKPNRNLIQASSKAAEKKHDTYTVNILDVLTYMETDSLLCKSRRLYTTYLELAVKPIEKLLGKQDNSADTRNGVPQTIDLLK